MKVEVFVPPPYAEQLEQAAAERKQTADEIAEKAMKEYLRSVKNGR